MLVSTALLSFIVLGLTAMFIQTQKIFKTGIKQTTITDAGRAIMDMIASDLSQMANDQFTNQYGGNSGNFIFPNLYWSWVPQYDLVQSNLNNNGVPVFRTNQVEDIFAMVQTNNTWLGIGYSVSNWFPGVGTLYRYVAQTNAPLYPTNLLYSNYNYQIGLGTYTNTLFHRIADGVVHLKIYAFDADGNEMSLEPSYDQTGYVNGTQQCLQYPCIELVTNSVTNSLGVVFQTNVFQTNYLPHSIDIELGILEPEAFEHVRALYASGAAAAASNYLANAAGQVEIFRQHIIIPSAQ